MISNSESSRRHKTKNKSLGLCVDCTKKVYPGNIRCASHLLKKRDSYKKYYSSHNNQKISYEHSKRKKLISQRKCITCGTSLLEEEKYLRCVNCLTHGVIKGVLHEVNSKNLA